MTAVPPLQHTSSTHPAEYCLSLPSEHLSSRTLPRILHSPHFRHNALLSACFPKHSSAAKTSPVTAPDAVADVVSTSDCRVTTPLDSDVKHTGANLSTHAGRGGCGCKQRVRQCQALAAAICPSPSPTRSPIQAIPRLLQQAASPA